MILSMMLSLAGCTGKEDHSQLTLALRSGVYSDVIRYSIAEFESQHGITCEIVELSEEDLHSGILNDSVNRKGDYDIVMVDGSWVAEFLSEDVLTDLGELGYSFDEDVIPATTTICVQNGKTYLVPYYGNVTVMMYNKDALASAGYSEADIQSLDDLLEFCNTSSESGYGGFAYRGDTENNIVVDFLPVLRAFGGWVVDDNNNPTVNTTEFKKALEYYIRLKNTGAALSKEELISSIESGESVAAVGWPGWYNAENSSTDYMAFPGKASDGAANYNSNIYGIWTLGIPDNSVNKELSCELLTYLMDPEVQKMTVTKGGVPCRYSSLTDPDILSNDPHLAVICDALENGIYRPVMEEWPNFYTILGQEMRKMIGGEISVDDGLNLAQQELESMLGK